MYKNFITSCYLLDINLSFPVPDMDRPALGYKATPWQRPRLDRFVMSRDSFEELRRRRSWDNDAPIDIWSSKHRHQKKYKSYLNEALGLEPQRASDEDLVAPWPCVARRKPFLSSADSILDLPTYSWAAFPERIDWSSNNLLVAALGRNYHMFGWRSQQVMGKGLTTHQIQSCKFDPRGELLLIGTDVRTVELHNNMWKLWTGTGRCRCSDDDGSEPCSITAVDWSPTGNSFVTGCSRGAVSAFDRTCRLLNTWRNSRRIPVLSARVSPDTRFVAIVKVNSTLVYVLMWPSLVYHSGLNSNLMIVKSITWHPWRPALLAVGGVTSSGTTVALWDTPSSRLKQMKVGDNHYTVDAMLFSRRTGELVLSLWNSDIDSIYPKISQLVVMSDLNTVVDQSGEGRLGLDRIRTMVFSPDGTKLATATADEDLIIWNFLPEDKEKEKAATQRRFSALPVYLDLVTQGFVLR